MQPLQYDSQLSAAKDNSITHAAAAPSNLDAAISMRFAASRAKRASLYAHDNKTWHQSCSHCTLRSATTDAISAYRYAHMNDHTLQNTKQKPIRRWNERSRTCRTHETLFTAIRSHFKRKNTVSCSSFLPKTNTSMQPFQCVFQHHAHIHAAMT